MHYPNVELLSKINREYPEKKIHFLHKLNALWKEKQPLKGIRVLHNLVNSFETLHKLENLLCAGADLTVTKVDLIDIVHRKEVEDIMERCEIRYVPNYQDLEDQYDIGLDCAARFLSLPQIHFKFGVVELTQSGTNLYRNAQTSYPVFSVDDSYLKNLECMYGTGEAFLRAIVERTGEDIKDRKFVIFGYGKIGQGVVKYLSTVTKNITVVEQSPEALARAQKKGFKTLAVHAHADQWSQQLRDAASEAFAVVTATGVPQLLSRYLSPSDLRETYIANMGAEDEIGDAFAQCERVLYGRAPINFSLRHPTKMRYLDPIFYAHNLAAELLLEQHNDLTPGYHGFDPMLDRQIIQEWTQAYGENVDDIWQSKNSPCIE